MLSFPRLLSSFHVFVVGKPSRANFQISSRRPRHPPPRDPFFPANLLEGRRRPSRKNRRPIRRRQHSSCSCSFASPLFGGGVVVVVCFARRLNGERREEKRYEKLFPFYKGDAIEFCSLLLPAKLFSTETIATGETFARHSSMTASAISGEKSTPERRASRRKLSSTSSCYNIIVFWVVG